jgi:hypothetical protein
MEIKNIITHFHLWHILNLKEQKYDESKHGKTDTNRIW